MSYFDHTYMDRSRPKGPDYLIIDNFEETFPDLEKKDLIDARSEAEILAGDVCGSQDDNVAYARCDNLIWLRNLDTHGDHQLPEFSKIAKAMAAFRLNLNTLS